MMMLLSRSLLGMVISTVLLPSLSAATVFVNVVGNSFVPKVVTVNVGDTVVWQNGQNVHTVSPGFGTPEPFCGGFAITSCGHTFTNVGSFTYVCNFHELSHSMTGLVIVAAVTNSSAPPTVAITSPAQNKLLAAHAEFNATVSASDPDGTVVSVTWQTNDVTCAVSTSAPFALSSLGGLPAGSHTLRAIATDSQSLRATSAPVSLRAVVPPVLRFDLLEIGTGQFQFQTLPGVNYILESTATLTNFSPLATNGGNGNVLNIFSGIGPGQNFFRLRLE